METLKFSKDVSNIITYLSDLSCCYRCIVRFLGIHVFEHECAYKDPQGYLKEFLNHKPMPSGVDETCEKKFKPNVCPVCLNCFQPNTIEKYLECFGSLSIEEYKYDNFFFNVSFPKCLITRAHGMLLHLRKQFPEFLFGSLYEKKLGAPDEIQLEQPHKIFRAVASEILAKALGKRYHPKSNLNLLITLGYDGDNLEVQNMKNIFRSKSSKKNQVQTSRNNISEYLKDIDDKTFEENFPVPPELPDKEVLLENVEISADPLYLGGRYLKFKRDVGQTPWVIDGVSVAEHNVQDIISDAVCNVLRCRKNDITFTASGREDVDVRMLGTGRPFYIKIDNPRQRHISSEQFIEIERQIVQTELAAVIKLQTIHPSDLERIKFGEEHKKKTYRALCKTTAPNISDVICKINKQEEELTISQLTVMRVLHRRTLMKRDKIIHKLTASEVPGHKDLFELFVVTQAGTYVKEFIHGDFERTKPNISSMVGYFTDLVALDVIDVALVWPEPEDDGVKHNES